MIAIAKAITPPNLLGIARRIAYTHRKYHSGLIWVGVRSGLAIIKLSGSIKSEGDIKQKFIKIIRKTMKPKISFEE